MIYPVVVSENSIWKLLRTYDGHPLEPAEGNGITLLSVRTEIQR